jgi:hypothetical protein
MKGIITKEALTFFEEAKQAFQEDESLATYTNASYADEKYISLRISGANIRDSIQIFKIEHEVAYFEEVLKPGKPLILGE